VRYQSESFLRHMRYSVVVYFSRRLIGDIDVIDPNAAVFHRPQPGDGLDQLPLSVAGNAGNTKNLVSKYLEKRLRLPRDSPLSPSTMTSATSRTVSILGIFSLEKEKNTRDRSSCGQVSACPCVQYPHALLPLPFRRTVTRSHNLFISSSLWLMRIIICPSSLIFSRISKKSRVS
jgi:hypothetical protein